MNAEDGLAEELRIAFGAARPEAPHPEHFCLLRGGDTKSAEEIDPASLDWCRDENCACHDEA